MKSRSRLASRGTRVPLVTLTIALAAVLAVLPARAASLQAVVSPLVVASGSVTGTVSGFAANAAVRVNGLPHVADANGVVTLNAAPLGNTTTLTIESTDAQGVTLTGSAPLTDSVSGLPLTLADVLDAVPSTAAGVTLDLAGAGSAAVDATTGGAAGGGTTGGTTGGTSGTSGGSSGAAGGGSGTAAGSGSSSVLPTGALMLANGAISIPASSVQVPNRLVIAKVTFTPSLVRSRAKPIVARYVVRDTRGFLVRDALVYTRGVPERRINAVTEQRSGTDGTVAFALRPTKLLSLRKGGRLTIFVRARKAGEPVNGGVSTRRLVSLRLSTAR